MTVQDERTVVTEDRADPTGFGRPVTSQTVESRRLTSSPSGAEFARRLIVVLFGLLQLVIGLRIVLLLLDARTGNDIVSTILNVSQVFVAPFEGILRTDALHAAGSTLDVAAVVAFVGWTIVELIVLWVLGIFRRGPTTA
jgi:YGGT family